METDIVIIGAGPVGIFTAFQAGVLGMKCHIIDSLEALGGQCSTLYPEKFIYDIPAHPKITGQELIEHLIMQASRFEPTYHMGQFANSIQRHNDSLVVATDQGLSIKAKAVVIAAGAGAFDYNRIPMESARNFEGESILYSVTNKNIFAGKKVVIAGGGDSAADWALCLADIASKIYLIHRRDKFRCAASTMVEIIRLKSSGKVEIVTPYQISDIQGHGTQIEKVTLSTLDGQQKVLETDYLLAFFGLKSSLHHLEECGFTIVNHTINVNPTTLCTDVPNIYAVGDVASYPGKLKLILCGFSESAMACHDIHKKMLGDKAYNFQYSTSMETFK